jgi:hypothetical protein
LFSSIFRPNTITGHRNSCDAKEVNFHQTKSATEYSKMVAERNKLRKQAGLPPTIGSKPAYCNVSPKRSPPTTPCRWTTLWAVVSLSVRLHLSLKHARHELNQLHHHIHLRVVVFRQLQRNNDNLKFQQFMREISKYSKEAQQQMSEVNKSIIMLDNKFEQKIKMLEQQGQDLKNELLNYQNNW